MMRSAFLLATGWIGVGVSLGAAQDKMAFDVASIKLSKTFTPPNFPLDNGDAFYSMGTKLPPGGRFSANFPLRTFIGFAWKLSLTQEEEAAMMARLPRWVDTDRYAIEARAEGNPTKDQMRLMMQSLLAERFQLAIHFETREVPVFTLEVIKPGKLGPNLSPHADGVACDGTAEAYPPMCDVYMMQMSSKGSKSGSRNTTMDLLASSLPGMGKLGRPVVDQTGLSGRFDFTLEWAPESSDTAPDAGPTFIDALREQLGLKLESTRGPIKTLVIDHVERPSEN